jgi:CheY-like chemotaxis protein
VEDVESAAAQLTRYLHELHLYAAVHPQGAGTLEQAIVLQPNVILLDLLIPDHSGWTILAELKADPRTREIPVIIVSVVDDRARGMAAGAAAYLVKPVDREALRKALSEVAATEAQRQHARRTIPGPSGEPAGGRILLVEDNAANIRALDEYLRAKAYEVVVAHTGQEALDQVSAVRPAIILMDIQMPEMDGLEAIRRLRAMPDYAATPIIALTAIAMRGDRERCLAAGATAYMPKPVSLKGLVELIEQLIHA